MLTGTPLDLTPFGSLLTALGWLYWVLALGVVVVAWRLPKRIAVKALFAAVALAVFLYPVLSREHAVTEKRQEARARLAESMALFAERCRTAGEKIHRTVDNVDGIVWMKWREEYSNSDNFADQFKLNDPYGRDCGLEDCIASLLRVSAGMSLNPEEAERHRVGYRFVETEDPRDGLLYRYRKVIKSVHTRTPQQIEEYKKNTGRDPGPDVYGKAPDRERIPNLTVRFGVLWVDLSTREDREHWIAGSSLKAIDLQTNEVLGERIGYMVDRGQGSQAGFRSPWLGAHQDACPEFPLISPSDSRRLRRGTETRDFVLKVLRPSQAE